MKRDVVLGRPTGLNFYKNGIITHSEEIPSANLSSIIYDPVHNRVLFSNKSNIYVISSFDIATRKIQVLLKCGLEDYYVEILNFAYDPATATIFRIARDSIYSFSLKTESNDGVYGNLLYKSDDYLLAIAVDSCGGYIYWSSHRNIQRARFDGSDREVVVHNEVYYRPELVIDQHTKKMYWIEDHSDSHRYGFHFSIESADLNGTNRKTLYTENTSTFGGSITVSKDFISWRLWQEADTIYWQLPKNLPDDRTGHYRTGPTQFSSKGICHHCDSIAAHYKVEDQTQGSRTCEALTSLLPSNLSNVSTDVTLFCVHGTNVTGKACKCTQGYTGERCDVPECQNYCLYGDCSVSDEQPKCRCNAGYSGERCEVNVCHKHCLNNGVCSLNEENQPVCQCTENYEGARCDVSVSSVMCLQAVSMLKNVLSTDLSVSTLGKEVKSTCVSALV